MDPTLFRLLLFLDGKHDTLHVLEHDFEQTVLLALTEKDIVLIGLALGAVSALWPCLDEDNLSLQHRIMELLQAQQPGWIKDVERPEVED